MRRTSGICRDAFRPGTNVALDCIVRLCPGFVEADTCRLAGHEPIETSSFRRIRRLIPLFHSVIAIQPGVECSGDAARLRRPLPQLQSY
jgi:hypothetical protein